MENFLYDVWMFIVSHWEMIFILTLPYIKDVLVSMRDFVKELKNLSKDTHEILKNHDERLTSLERRALNRS